MPILTKERVEAVKRGNWIPKFLTPAILMFIAVQLVNLTTFITDLDDRSFTSVEMRVEVEKHMEVWTPENQYQAFARLEKVEQDVALLKIAVSEAEKDRIEFYAILKRIEKDIRDTRRIVAQH